MYLTIPCTILGNMRSWAPASPNSDVKDRRAPWIASERFAFHESTHSRSHYLN